MHRFCLAYLGFAVIERHPSKLFEWNPADSDDILLHCFSLEPFEMWRRITVSGRPSKLNDIGYSFSTNSKKVTVYPNYYSSVVSLYHSLI